MSETTTLTLRIEPDLKERIKTLALQKEGSVSAVVAELLKTCLDKELKITAVNAEDVDNQAPEAVSVEPELTAKELKALRKILRKK